MADEPQPTVRVWKDDQESQAKSIETNSKELDSVSSAKTDFYNKAQKYWSNVPATVNGMLGGLGCISAIDIRGSSAFLKELRVLGSRCALDCGAGIGRVTKNLLMPRFTTVDMVEQDANFANEARNFCISQGDAKLYRDRIGTIFNVGLQQFCPEAEKYDLIWSQWVLGHLTDADLLAFFKRLRNGLTKCGYFVIKENVTSKDVELDDTDSSVTRPLKVYERLLREAHYRIVKTTRQQGFPKGLYEVYMIACKPLADVT